MAEQELAWPLAVMGLGDIGRRAARAALTIPELELVAATDSALIAASAFQEHGFKTLPVVADKTSRRIVGVVRVRKLIAKVLEVVPPPTGLSAPPIPPA